MDGRKTDPTVTEALDFLSSRIAEQARDDSEPLTETELSQVLFSEETASPEELAAAHEFDLENDAVKFEAKITRLLRRAYQVDVRRGMRQIWQKHLSDLRDRDIYILVMVDQARIPRPTPSISKSLMSAMLSRKLLSLITFPVAVAAMISFCGFVYFFLLPMRWSRSPNSPRIFGNLAENLVPSESIRGALFVIWIVSVLWLAFAYRKRNS